VPGTLIGEIQLWGWKTYAPSRNLIFGLLREKIRDSLPPVAMVLAVGLVPFKMLLKMIPDNLRDSFDLRRWLLFGGITLPPSPVRFTRITAVTISITRVEKYCKMQ
jgi:hypothetical protein